MPYFNPILPLNIIICPKDEDISKHKNLNITKEKCKVDTNTSLYVNQN